MRLLVVLLFVAALAGCADDDPSEASKLNPDPAPTGAPPSATTTSTTAAPTNDPEPGPTNTAPGATLEASPVTGQAPLAVTFTANGSDPDGDPLAWSLDVDGDGVADAEGDALPATYEHTFDAGSYVANLTVSDGSESATASIAIEVAVAEEPAPGGPTQTVDGTYTVPLEGCTIAYPSHLAEQDLGYLVGGDLDGVTRIQFAVEPTTFGNPFIVTWTFDVGYLYAGLAFTDAEGAILGSVATDPTAQEAGFDAVTKEGTVPDGAVFGVAWTCGGPTEASVHYEA